MWQFWNRTLEYQYCKRYNKCWAKKNKCKWIKCKIAMISYDIQLSECSLDLCEHSLTHLLCIIACITICPCTSISIDVLVAVSILQSLFRNLYPAVSILQSLSGRLYPAILSSRLYPAVSIPQSLSCSLYPAVSIPQSLSYSLYPAVSILQSLSCRPWSSQSILDWVSTNLLIRSQWSCIELTADDIIVLNITTQNRGINHCLYIKYM